MLLAKSRPIVVIFMTDGSHFARERRIAFTLWHLDAVSGSHPHHLFWGHKQTLANENSMSASPPKAVIHRRDGDVRFVPIVLKNSKSERARNARKSIAVAIFDAAICPRANTRIAG